MYLLFIFIYYYIFWRGGGSQLYGPHLEEIITTNDYEGIVVSLPKTVCRLPHNFLGGDLGWIKIMTGRSGWASSVKNLNASRTDCKMKSTKVKNIVCFGRLEADPTVFAIVRTARVVAAGMT